MECRQNTHLIFLKERRYEGRADQCLARLLEIAAVSVVDEGQDKIGREAADQFALVFDNSPVAGFAGAKLLLSNRFSGSNHSHFSFAPVTISHSLQPQVYY